MKLFKVIVFLAASVGTIVYGLDFKRASSLEDVHMASCRVSVSGARGSGTFVGWKNNEAYILTNYHVVTNNSTATLEFWTNSVLQRIPGKVVWRAYNVNASKPKDFAFIVVDAQRLKDEIDPPYIPLAGSNVRPTNPSYIVSSGAPDGRFVQAWKGKVIGYYNGETVEFQPPPVPGQSGSGIVSLIDGEYWVTAVLTWLFGEKGRDDSSGGAIPITNLYEAIKRNPMPTAIEDSDKTPSIPDNATECAEKTESYTALVFTSPDCLACKAAADDLAQIEQYLPVKKINTKTKNGYTTATAYFVSYVPSVVIVDSKDEIKLAITPEDISNGNLLKKIESFQAQFMLDCDDDICPIEPQEKKPIGQSDDFRYRESVHEELIETGFIDDSERFWRNRKGDVPQQDEKEEEDDSSCQNNEVEQSRLINRITDNLVGKLGTRIDSTIDKTTQKFMSKIDEVSGTITDTVNKRIDTEVVKAKKSLKAIAFKGVITVCLFFLILSWFSSFIKSIVKKTVVYIYKKTITYIKGIANAENKGVPGANP